jgi:urease alpha subunit
MSGSLDTTNTWLAVLTVTVLIQTLLMLAAAFAAWRAIRHTTAAVDRLEQQYLVPLASQVHAVTGDVQEVITRVRRADDAVRAQIGRLDGLAHVAGHAIGARVWPVVGLSRAVLAAVRSLSSRSSTLTPSDPPRVARAAMR